MTRRSLAGGLLMIGLTTGPVLAQGTTTGTRAQATGTQALTDFSNNPIQFGQTVLTGPGLTSNATGDTFTVNQAGLFDLSGHVLVQGSQSGLVTGQVLVNGTAVQSFASNVPSVNGFAPLDYSALASLHVGDTVRVVVNPNVGTVTTFANGFTTFDAAQLAGASGTHAQATGSQALTDFTNNPVQFGQTVLAGPGLTSNAAGDTFTVTQAGLFNLSGHVLVQGSQSGLVTGQVLVNGVSVESFASNVPSVNGYAPLDYSTLASLHVGDTVRIVVNPSVGTNTTFANGFTTLDATQLAVPAGTHAQATGTQALVNFSNNVVQFGQTVLAGPGLTSNANGDTFTVTQAGLFEISGHVLVQGSQSGLVTGQVLVNGISVESFASNVPTTNGYAPLDYSYLGNLQVGDTVRVVVDPSVGTNTTFANGFTTFDAVGYFATVPEPSSIALAAAGLAAGLVARLRSRRRSARRLAS